MTDKNMIVEIDGEEMKCRMVYGRENRLIAYSDGYPVAEHTFKSGVAPIKRAILTANGHKYKRVG